VRERGGNVREKVFPDAHGVLNPTDCDLEKESDFAGSTPVFDECRDLGNTLGNIEIAESSAPVTLGCLKDSLCSVAIEAKLWYEVSCAYRLDARELFMREESSG